MVPLWLRCTLPAIGALWLELGLSVWNWGTVAGIVVQWLLLGHCGWSWGSAAEIGAMWLEFGHYGWNWGTVAHTVCCYRHVVRVFEEVEVIWTLPQSVPLRLIPLFHQKP